jgi:MoaA/NifB/PqqE/SkfB family radical SAM enzyme
MVKTLLKKRVPGQLVIQFTDRCNASCPQCGMRGTLDFQRSDLDTDKASEIIDAAAKKGIQSLSFTGGEPLLRKKDLIRLIRCAVDSGIPYVRTGTNGFLFTGAGSKGFEKRVGLLAEQLAGSGLRNFWISVDSTVPGVHESMRGLPGVIEGIRKALPVFHENGLYPSANLGINRNITKKTMDLDPSSFKTERHYLDAFHKAFREGFREFYSFVAGMGFTIVNSCYPMSVEPGTGLDAVYTASSKDRVVRFTDAEKHELYKALYLTIPEFRDIIRIFTPRTSLYSLMAETSDSMAKKNTGYPCRGGVDFFFIDAAGGRTYPCGYRGKDDLGPFPDLDIQSIGNQSIGHKAHCRECHWECFRDPSELAGPFLNLFSNPFGVAARFMKNGTYLRLWLEDLAYYRRCGWFDGRKGTVPKRVSRGL